MLAFLLRTAPPIFYLVISAALSNSIESKNLCSKPNQIRWRKEKWLIRFRGRWFDRCPCCTELWLPCRPIRATSMIHFMAKKVSCGETLAKVPAGSSAALLHETNKFLSDLDVCVIVGNSRKWIFLELNWTQFIGHYIEIGHWRLTTKHWQP